MNKEEKKRITIFFLFFAGIVLPSLVMGYLAYRGIQDDRALREKQLLEDSRRFAFKVNRVGDDMLLEIEKDCAKLLQINHISPQEWKNFKKSHPLVEEIFLLDNQSRLVFPVANLLFISDGEAMSRQNIHAESTELSLMDSARKLEFQDKNYFKAISLYQDILKKIDSPWIRGESLLSLARIQKKAGLTTEAIDSYGKIIDEFNQVTTLSGIPLCLAAYIELGEINYHNSSFPEAIDNYLKAYEGLLLSQWKLPKSGYEAYSEMIRDSIGNILEKHGPFEEQEVFFQEVKFREKRLIEYTERLLNFSRNALSVIKPSSVSGSSWKRMELGFSGESYLISLSSQAGIIFHKERLASDIILPELDKDITREEIIWIVRDNQGNVVFQSGETDSGVPDQTTGLNNVFPGWTLELYNKNLSLWKSFVSEPSGIFFYMFLFIGGILAIGLILTVRLVNRELELARVKTDFVSTVSHELKSPLTSIRQLTEMLYANRVPSEERRFKYYEVLLNESERLSLLTENILDLSCMEKGMKNFYLEKINMDSLLLDVVTGFRDRLQTLNFKIVLEIDQDLPPVFADIESFRLAVRNLIDNAIKYSGPSRRAVVRAEKKGKYLSISVQDFGPGISHAEQKRIFDKFYRCSEAFSRKVKGSGLGLTLVKQVMVAHKGSVEIKSFPGKGSTFILRLPIEYKRGES